MKITVLIAVPRKTPFGGTDPRQLQVGPARVDSSAPDTMTSRPRPRGSSGLGAVRAPN